MSNGKALYCLSCPTGCIFSTLQCPCALKDRTTSYTVLWSITKEQACRVPTFTFKCRLLADALLCTAADSNSGSKLDFLDHSEGQTKWSSDCDTRAKEIILKQRIINWLNKTNTTVVAFISGGLTLPKGMRWTGWQYGVGTASYFLTQLRIRSLSWTSGRRLSTSSHSSIGTAVWRGSQTSASWEIPSGRIWPAVHELKCEKGPKEPYFLRVLRKNNIP